MRVPISATKRVICILVLIALSVIHLSSAFATGFTFEQVVSFISACRVNGDYVFTDGQMSTYNRSTLNGPILIWFSDADSGMFLFPKNNSNEIYVWNDVRKEYLGSIMTFLVPTLSDYVDYDHGAVLTFRVTRMSDSQDFVVLSYSPRMRNADNRAYGVTFSDSNLFYEEVRRYADIIMQ